MFKVKYNLCPEIMKNLFQPILSSSEKKTFNIPKVNSEYMGKLSLRYFGPVVWEIMLPESFKTITELQEFKAKIRKWVPTNCICRLCKIIQRFV